MKIYTVNENEKIVGYFVSPEKAKKEIERTPGHWHQEIDTDNNETGQYITDKNDMFGAEIRILGWIDATE